MNSVIEHRYFKIQLNVTSYAFVCQNIGPAMTRVCTNPPIQPLSLGKSLSYQIPSVQSVIAASSVTVA